MRILLLYPPPWKIPTPGEAPDKTGEGPPSDWNPAYQLSGDIVHIPYGLLGLAAQAKAIGHEVTVFNLFTFAWRDVHEIIRYSPADVFGLSCFTSNRRGVLSTARLIREIHHDAHIVVGGPHASALPREMLEHCTAIDTIVIGEGEKTFKELISRLEHNLLTTAIPGTAFRNRDAVEIASPRRQIENIDSLVPACCYFDDHIVLTSRGCYADCTFCASPLLWGKNVRFHSPDYVLDMLENLVHVQGHRAIAIKDDTFTCNRARVLEICSGIRTRQLNFLWSCDTRPDALDEELLCAMRRAGCQRISLGVESAAPEILRSLKKKTTPEQVQAATKMARTFGFQIRYYMMAGSPGETVETLTLSMEFLKQALPSQFIFNPFTLLPGTEECAIAECAGRMNREMFFTKDFFELYFLFEKADNPKLNTLLADIARQPAVQEGWGYSIAELQSILTLFPDLPAAHLDLGGAWYDEGNMAKAEKHIKKALALGYPLPGLGYNYLAGSAATRGDLKGTLENLLRARECGLHRVVEENLQSVREWLAAGGQKSGRALQLLAHHDFEITRRNTQPVTPGPVSVHNPDAPPDSPPLVFTAYKTEPHTDN